MSELAWFHCILTTYGAWLPGDPRGFRARHHREHIEGDYKSPPPSGIFETRLRRSKQLMPFRPTVLGAVDRSLLGPIGVTFLQERCENVLAVAISARHLHLQIRCPKTAVIAKLGELKRHLWYERRQKGRGERLWGKGRKIVPIETKEHQRSVFWYIANHREQGAWVWTYRDAQ